jgi:DNA helicase HerA-like ATPase
MATFRSSLRLCDDGRSDRRAKSLCSADLSNFLLLSSADSRLLLRYSSFSARDAAQPAARLLREAQELCPRRSAGVGEDVGAFERLIKLGRNFGIGATLISQRPQAVNKDVLNQTECLLAFQMTGHMNGIDRGVDRGERSE